MKSAVATDITRRAILTVVAGLAAATAALGSAIGVVLNTTPAAPDSIPQLLAEHVAACRAYDAAPCGLQSQPDPGFRTPDEMDPVAQAAYDALLVEIRAARAVGWRGDHHAGAESAG